MSRQEQNELSLSLLGSSYLSGFLLIMCQPWVDVFLSAGMTVWWDSALRVHMHEYFSANVMVDERRVESSDEVPKLWLRMMANGSSWGQKNPKTPQVVIKLEGPLKTRAWSNLVTGVSMTTMCSFIPSSPTPLVLLKCLTAEEEKVDWHRVANCW